MNLEKYLREQRKWLDKIDDAVKNCKLALFDFDDTLIIHNNHSSFTDPDEHKYNIKVFEGTYNWSNGMANRHMKEMLELLKSQGTQLGLISATFSFKHMQTKQEHIKQIYGVELENYCVGSSNHKVPLLEDLTVAKGLKRNQIIFVDDKGDLISKAANEGFIALSPMQVVNYIEWKDNKGENIFYE